MTDRRLLLLLGFAGAVGCATSASTFPEQERVDAHATLAAAERLEQHYTPRVEAHLARAREDIRKGDAAITAAEYDVARFYFERSASSSDAAIAWAHAKEAEQLASIEGEVHHEGD